MIGNLFLFFGSQVSKDPTGDTRMARPRRVYSKSFVPASLREKFIELLHDGPAADSGATHSGAAPALTLAGFREAYRRKFGEDLLHSKFGFDSIRSMLASLPTLIRLYRESLEISSLISNRKVVKRVMKI